jgi:hypothetical protein
MLLTCPRCNRVLHREDLLLQRGIGVCTCGEMMPLPDAATLAQSAPMVLTAPLPYAVEPAPSGALYRPSDLNWVERPAPDGGVEISLAPNRTAALPLFFFCLFWDGFLVFWYAIVVKTGAAAMGLFALLHVAAGVVLTLKMLRTAFNTTRISIGRSGVRHVDGPIPPRSALDASCEEIDGFVASSPGASRGQSSVVVNLRNGRSVKWSLNGPNELGAGYAALRLNQLLAEARAPVEPMTYRG